MIPSEATLAYFRECPELAVRLAREMFDLDIPPASPARVADIDFPDLAASGGADLVIEVGGDRPALGLILEVQREIDPRKPHVWPAYNAVVHARLRCQTCLAVIAFDEQVAAWAGQPITFHVGSPFRPLVLGPAEVPRMLQAAAAARAPELAVLAALIHGQRPGGVEIATTALDAVAGLDESRALFCHDLILGSLPQAMIHAVEQTMLSRSDPQSSFTQRYFAERRARPPSPGATRA